MSEAPSWLTEENISTAAKVTQNPAAQKAAKSVAKNPEVQKAVKKKIVKAASAPTADNAPNWANNDESGYVPPGGDVEAQAGRQSSAAQSSEFVIEEETLKAMQRWHLALRLAYMAAAILMSAAAVEAFLSSSANIGIAFFAIYTLFFSAMICCFECGLSVSIVHLRIQLYVFIIHIQAIARLIAVNFGFMYSLAGRGIFLLFVGFMSYQLLTFGKITMGVLYGVGLFHAFIMWKFPRFEEYLRKKHYFEGKRSAAKI